MRWLKLLAGGDALLPLRQMMLLPGKLRQPDGLMPSSPSRIQSVGVQVIAAFPTNQGTEHDTHQGVVILFGTDTVCCVPSWTALR